jgi:hypothetical protein
VPSCRASSMPAISTRGTATCASIATSAATIDSAKTPLRAARSGRIRASQPTPGSVPMVALGGRCRGTTPDRLVGRVGLLLAAVAGVVGGPALGQSAQVPLDGRGQPAPTLASRAASRARAQRPSPRRRPLREPGWELAEHAEQPGLHRLVGGGQHVPPPVGEDVADPPPVVPVGAPLDPAALDEAVDDGGDVRPADGEVVGQGGAGRRPAVEQRQDPVLRQGQPELAERALGHPCQSGCHPPEAGGGWFRHRNHCAGWTTGRHRARRSRRCGRAGAPAAGGTGVRTSGQPRWGGG